MKVGVAGSGAMGSGIAQVAAQSGHQVVLFDVDKQALLRAETNLRSTLNKLIEKGKMTAAVAETIRGSIGYSSEISAFSACGLVIEAIVEDEGIKRSFFKELEKVVGPEAVLATNTSSLSVTSIAGACTRPERVIGIHFFNPAPVMPLVEIVPALQTSPVVVSTILDLLRGWGKTVVQAKDTPGFIVNRVARPYYGEALRIAEEGLATYASIDLSMKQIGGFRMGPFELMDMIGNDVNYAVTESVYRGTYYDPRYRPSIIQKRLVEAGWLGKKSGKGYYEYGEPDGGTVSGTASDMVFMRILCMLINEAYDAVFYGIATEPEIELAMTRGVNYPKGLFAWSREIGLQKITTILDGLTEVYGEDRYRCSPLLRRLAG